MKEIDIQVQEAQRVPNKMNPRRPTLRHIIIKMLKVKDERENLKSSKRIAVRYLQGSSHKTCQLISQKKLQARRDWQETFKVMKKKDLQPILFDPAKLSFRIEGQIRSFPHKKS